MKKVLITGGNKGIGLAITNKFLANGFHVVVVAKDQTGFQTNPNLEFIKFDLTEYKNIPELAKKVGHVDILINNAGILQNLPYDSYPNEKVDEILAINLRAPYALIVEFSKEMITRGEGRIVNVGSIAGHVGTPTVWYGVTKAGMMNFTKSFSKILGPKGIIINAVAPGIVNTDMKNSIPEERKTIVRAGTILNRFAEPEEIAETVYWLSSESPEYINGTIIDINNGFFLR